MFDQQKPFEQTPEATETQATAPAADHKAESAPRKPVRLPAHVMHG